MASKMVPNPYTKAEAFELISRLKKNDELIPFFNAVIDGKAPQYFLNRLKMFKGYRDDLPRGKLKAGDNAKCRGNTIARIRGDLEALLEQGLVKDDGILAAIEEYRRHEWKCGKPYIGMGNELRTTPEEIKFINSTLDAVIGYLEREYKLESPRYFLERLQYFKLNHSDELPANIVSGARRSYEGKLPLKGSTTCIIGIRACLENMIIQNVIKNPGVLATAENFIHYEWNATKSNPDGLHLRTSPEEIARINRTLDILMDYLKATYNLQ